MKIKNPSNLSSDITRPPEVGSYDFKGGRPCSLVSRLSISRLEGFWNWRYNYLILSCVIAWPHDLSDERRPFDLSHHCANDGYRPLGKWDLLFSFCPITPRDYMNKGICLSEWEPFNLCLHCAKVDAYRFFENGHRTILFCHMLSRDHIIKWTCDFVRGSSSTKAITDSTFMLTGLKKLEMKRT